MKKRTKKKLTDEGLMVVLSILLIPSMILVCFESCLAIACAGLWAVAAVVIAKIWAPGWANRIGDKNKRWLND